MNGRVYDYNIGRFLSVDPILQAPTSTQSPNPYSYIMNNPLAGTDPTGYTIEIIVTCASNSPPSCGEGPSYPDGNSDSNGGKNDDKKGDGKKGPDRKPDRSPISPSDIDKVSKNSSPLSGGNNSRGGNLNEIGSLSLVSRSDNYNESDEDRRYSDTSQLNNYSQIGSMDVKPKLSRIRQAMSYLDEYGLNALQTVGGLGQIYFAVGLMSNPITALPGAFILVHGIMNTAQGTRLVRENYAQKAWRRYLGRRYGDYAYFSVDFLSAGWSALGKSLTKLGVKASRTGTIHHSQNINNALNKNTIHFKADKTHNFRTTSGAALAGNDAVVLSSGLRQNDD